MAIPSGGFGLLTVYNEFATNTKANLANNLSSLHNKIFGNAGAGAKLSNFANTGKPEFISATASTSNTPDGYIDGSCTVDANSVETYVAFQYQEEASGYNAWDSNHPNAIRETLYQSVGTGSSISHSITFDTGQANTSFHVRAVAYNAYNDDPTTDGVSPANREDAVKSSTTTVLSSDVQQLSIPSNINSLTYRPSSQQVYVNLTYNDPEDGFTCEITQNGNLVGIYSSFACQVNVGTSNNPKEFIINTSTSFNSGDTVTIKIKATSTTLQDSNYGLPFEMLEDVNQPTCPL